MEENIENGLECGQPHCLTLAESQGTGQRGILIQLTGTEGEWDSLDESNLVVTLDYGEEVPSASHIDEALREEDFGLRSPAFHVPLSPSSPSSLGDSCVSGPSLLSPHLNPGPATPISRPFVNLVKSLSTEIESKDASSLRSKPLLSLVKSISTEISRSDPEVSQSKSDSKLNLHLWKQLTQPKGRMGDCRTAPPSPGSLSPPEAKVGFFKAELEDTRRKFSEAMQEPLSMFSKIMGDESSGSPKHQKVAESHGSKGACGGGGKTNSDCVATETPSRNTKAVESDCDVPLRRPRRTPQKPCLSPWLCTKLGSRGNKLEICTCGDIIQVMEFAGREPASGLPGDLVSERPPPPVPDKRLLLVAVLTYSYLILPLPSYLSGLSLGLACGFMLGLLLVLLVTPRHSARTERRVHTLEESSQSEIFCREHKDPDVLKGWMNEVYEYDPDTFNPTLTHSVYASLEGSCLQLAYPRTNAPRWATVHEPPIEAAFISSRRYQLANSKVFLLPRFLARKRVWNKKYPICVVLAEGEEGVVEEGTEALEGEQNPGLQRPPAQPGRPTSLYLFGRTGRAKEEWFQHLMAASTSEDKDNHSRYGSKIGVSPPCGSSPASLAQCCGDSTRGSTEDIPSRLQPRDLVVGVSRTILLDYHSYVARLVASETGSPLSSPCYSAEGSPTTKRKLLCKCWGGHTEAQTAWINALIGRTFWDFLREKYWADQVARKIQKKLSKIRLPYFMDELTLTELDMGTCMPQVASISKPSANHKGLWLELELVYTGSLQMTLETKMNLSKLGKDGEAKADAVPETGSVTSRPRAGVLADSDEESSSAGSSDDEEVPASELPGCAGDKGAAASSEGYGGGRTSRKILRLVDKIAKSKYFQKATENEFIKKKIEEVSNTPLLLTVEVQELSGTLAINIPPPPTDRIWYSFCVPPKLDLRVRPKLGEREVTLTHITEWIEKKLQREFEKVFVMPNMDDLYLPLMHSGLDSPPTSKQSLAQSRRSSVESLEKPGQENAFESEQCLLVEMGANTL